MTRFLARGLAVRGHQVTVVGLYAQESDSRERIEGVEVVRLRAARLARSGFVVNGHRLRQALAAADKDSKIDIVDGPEASFATLRSSSPGSKLIRMNGGHRFFAATLGERASPWRSFLENRSFSLADELCGVSQFVIDKTFALHRLQPREVEVLPNPVDVQWFAPVHGGEVSGRIVFFGTFTKKKGLSELLEALPSILADFPEAHLVAIGRDTYAPDGSSFVETALERIDRRARSRVHLMSHVNQEDLPSLLATATVVVCPSHMESFGMVWAETMAMGRALVGSRTGPGPEVILDGKTGILCDPHDPKSIASAAKTLLGDEALRDRLGAAGRERVLSEFSLEKLLPRNEALYQRILARTRN